MGDMGIGDTMGRPQIGPYSGVVEKLPFGRPVCGPCFGWGGMVYKNTVLPSPKP